MQTSNAFLRLRKWRSISVPKPPLAYTYLSSWQIPIAVLSRFKKSQSVDLDSGILFLSYNLLLNRHENFLVGTNQALHLRPLTNVERFRYEQVKDWLGGDFEGVIIFDEAHKSKNLGTLKVVDVKKQKKQKKPKGPLVRSSYYDDDDDDVREDEGDDANVQEKEMLRVGASKTALMVASRSRSRIHSCVALEVRRHVGVFDKTFTLTDR